MDTTAKPTVTRIQQVTNFSPTGQPLVSYVVTFNTGDHGPFTVTIPQEDFNAVEVLKRVDELAATVYQVAAPRGA
jgi:hypothetical protein